MDSKLLTILTILEPEGLQKKVNISTTIDELFPMPLGASGYDFNIVRDHVNRFLRDINKNDSPNNKTNGYIAYDAVDINYIKTFRDDRVSWFDTLNVSITDEGIEALKRERDRQAKAVLDSSAINVNDSIVSTNQSVRDTNEVIATISTIQRNLSIVSTIALVLSTLVAIAIYLKGDPQVQQSIHRSLQRQEQILQSMQRSQKGIDSSLRIMAKKIDPKK